MCITYITAYLITVPTSIFILLAISVDPFMSLKDPLRRFRSTEFATQARAIIVISIIWIYSIIWALLPIMGWREKGLEPIYKGFCMIPFTKLYTTLSSFLNFVGPLLLTCVFFTLAFIIACTHQRGVHRFNIAGPSRHPSKEEARFYVRNLRAAKTTSMFLAAFFICWQPYFSIVSNLYGGEHWKPYPWKVYEGLLMLGYLSSALNPFLFAFRNKQFKATYAKLFCSPKRAADPKSALHHRSNIAQTLSYEILETCYNRIRLQWKRHKRAKKH